MNVVDQHPRNTTPTYVLFWYFSGNFSFPAVVQGLTNMLKDPDPNIRAVATIALAKSGLCLLYHNLFQCHNEKFQVEKNVYMFDW
jgi:hypothetical protein